MCKIDWGSLNLAFARLDAALESSTQIDGDAIMPVSGSDLADEGAPPAELDTFLFDHRVYEVSLAYQQEKIMELWEPRLHRGARGLCRF